MDKYLREADVKLEDPNHPPTANEIRVTTAGKMRAFITYASKKLQDNNTESITLKAMGRAIHKTVLIAEIIKRRFQNLHQITQIDSTLIPEIYYPKEEGLDPVKTTRNVSSILITLFIRPPPDTNTIGYQAPLSETPAASSISAGQNRPPSSGNPRPHNINNNNNNNRGRRRPPRDRGGPRTRGPKQNTPSSPGNPSSPNPAGPAPNPSSEVVGNKDSASTTGNNAGPVGGRQPQEGNRQQQPPQEGNRQQQPPQEGNRQQQQQQSYGGRSDNMGRRGRGRGRGRGRRGGGRRGGRSVGGSGGGGGGGGGGSGVGGSGVGGSGVGGSGGGGSGGGGSGGGGGGGARGRIGGSTGGASQPVTTQT